MRESGLTLEAIAMELGLTRERIRQICKKYGLRTGKVLQEQRRIELEQRKQALRSDVATFIVTHPGSTRGEIAQACGVDESKVNRLIPSDLRRLVLIDNKDRRSLGRQWSDEEVFEAIRAAATYEFPLTSAGYSELVRVGEIDGPTVARIHQRFGGWSRACGLADVESGVSSIPYTSNWTDDDILRFVVMYLSDPKYSGAFHMYDKWRSEKCDDAPSSGMVRNRLGEWSTVKEIALTQMRNKIELGGRANG
jgi:hypothetical protein